MGFKAIVYDSEVVRPVPPRGKPMLQGIEYCKSWTDYLNMGISVVAAYEYALDRYRVFCRDNAQYFIWLVNQADVIIGFNSIKFDNELLAAHGVSIPVEKCYDMLVEIWLAAGLGPEYKHGTHAGFSLDNCVRANFGLSKKQGGGAMAPVDWQRGNIGNVIDYCIEDVRMTKLLVDRVIEKGELVNPVQPDEILKVRRPW